MRAVPTVRPRRSRKLVGTLARLGKNFLTRIGMLYDSVYDESLL